MDWNRIGIWVMALTSLVFMGWFSLTEAEGWKTLGDFLLNAVLSIPVFFENIAIYYRDLPSEQLLPTLWIGAALGGGLTAVLWLGQRGIWHLPPLHSAWAGLLLVGGMLWAGIGLWLALLAGLGLVLLLTLLFEPRVKDFVASLGGVAQPEGLKYAGQGLLLGGIVGALGAQMLNYPMRHCTFAPEASATQAQMGMTVTMVGALVWLLPLWTLLFQKRQFEFTAGYFKGWSIPYLLLSPTLILFGLFLYYPAVQIILLSLKSRVFPLPQERFVCLDNYVNLSKDTIYQNSLQTTVFITVALVIITMSLALGIAVLASQKVRGAAVYRTLLIWPFALSPVVSAVIFRAMFREGDAGLINFFFSAFIGQNRWLTDAELAPWVVILAAVWNGLGFNILFYIAGLQNVPTDLLEAAAIDGANVVQRFVRITIPLLSPFTFFLLITNITYAFYGIYGAVDALTAGGPPLGPAGVDGGATNVLIYNLYTEGFRTGGSAGRAAAQALILFLLVSLLTLLQFRYVENRVTYSA